MIWSERSAHYGLPIPAPLRMQSSITCSSERDAHSHSCSIFVQLRRWSDHGHGYGNSSAALWDLTFYHRCLRRSDFSKTPPKVTAFRSESEKLRMAGCCGGSPAKATALHSRSLRQ
jgi:hypothetical protein